MQNTKILKFLPVFFLAAALLVTTWNAALQARTAEAAYTLTVQKSGNGTGRVIGTIPTSPPPTSGLIKNVNAAGSETVIDCGSICTYTSSAAPTITLTAQADSGSVFAGWSGGGCSGTGSCSVTLTSNKTVTATFNKISIGGVGGGTSVLRSLTLKKGAHGKVTSNIEAITTCANNTSEITTCTANIAQNTQVTLTPNPDSGYEVENWTGCDSVAQNICTVTMSGNKTISVGFKAKSVTNQPCLKPDGTTVTFGGYCEGNVAIWCENNVLASQNCSNFGQGYICQIDKSPTALAQDPRGLATCMAPKPKTLHVTLTGDGNGNVVSEPIGISCLKPEPNDPTQQKCSKDYDPGTSVTLTATPADDSTFMGWGGACASRGNAATCTLTMETNKEVTARFDPKVSGGVGGGGPAAECPGFGYSEVYGTLELGDANVNVASLQIALNKYLPLPKTDDAVYCEESGLSAGCLATKLATNGNFDNQTEAAVRAYQAKKGLGVDGKVGRRTSQAIYEDYQACLGVTPSPTTCTPKTCESGLYALPTGRCTVSCVQNSQQIYRFINPLAIRTSLIKAGKPLRTSLSARRAAQILWLLGYTSEDFSNRKKWSSALVTATQAFQEAADLNDDGKIGKKTREALIEAYFDFVGLPSPYR